MQRKVDNSQSGKSLLELILWLPILFFFLFAVSSIALYFRDIIMINDTLRSSLNNEFLFNQGRSVLSLVDEGQVQLSGQVAEHLGVQLAESLHESVKNKMSQGPLNANSYREEFLIQIAMVELNFDQITGQLRSFDVVGHHFFEMGDFSLKDSVVSAERIISGYFSSDDKPSRYAVLAGLDYAGPSRGSGNNTLYLPKGVVCFARVTSVPRTFAPDITSAILGRKLIIDQSEIRLLRVPSY